MIQGLPLAYCRNRKLPGSARRAWATARRPSRSRTSTAEALDSVSFAHQHGIHLDIRGWTSLRTLLDWLVDHRDQARRGLWETCGGRRRFTYGRVMSWVAPTARCGWRSPTAGRPRVAAGAPSATTSTTRPGEGLGPDRGAFVQHYGSDVLDSSLLRMPTEGFITPDDPMTYANHLSL
ncbi:glycoside hydrolase family 15 protein [Streptomyces sp. NBC_00045]|uniref:glycoside hydrolase family 15 protein n=2 Tax=unclassified Streptomyces TaxID=2593676 RepID=UPI00386D10D5